MNREDNNSLVELSPPYTEDKDKLAGYKHNEREDSDDEEQYDKCSYYSLWMLFFTVGTFNNFGYVVVLSAAKSLADCFGQSSLIGVESWALIGTGFVVKSVNAFYLEGLSHRLRGWIAAIMFFMGYALLSISVYVDFWFAIFAILLIGTACSFGESVVLGYCKLFPPKMSGAWSSGTGMAGLSGSGLYLLLAQVLKFSNQAIFTFMIPSAIVYVIAIEYSWKSKLRKPWRNELEKGDKETEEPLLLNDAIPSETVEEKEESQWERIKRCWMLSWYRNILLFLVYVFEYVISVGIAQIANTNRPLEQQDFDYVLLGTCYQLGVFMSRSSVSVVELPYFGTMTLLQGLNVVIWVIHAETDLFHYEVVEYVLMVYVGLLGGAMYVNCAYSLLSDKDISAKDKELCVNMMALAVNVGITVSSLIEIATDKTIFKHLIEKSEGGDSAASGCAVL